MLLQNIEIHNGWTYINYEATFQYGVDIIKSAINQVIQTDFKNQVQQLYVLENNREIDLLSEFQSNGNDLFKLEINNDRIEKLIVSGISEIMECPIQLIFYNQTRIITLCTPEPIAEVLIKQYGENIFTQYVSSIEINAYSALSVKNYKR